MTVVPELRADAGELSLPLDEDVAGAVHENVGDRRIAEQRFDRTQAGDFPHDLLDDLLALRLAEWGRLLPEELADGQTNLVNDFASHSITSLGEFRKNITVDVFNEAGVLAISYNLYRAWVADYQALPDLDSSANAVAITTIKLEYEWFERDLNVNEVPPFLPS